MKIKTNWVTQSELAKKMNVSPGAVTLWKQTGKLTGLIRNNKVNLGKALKFLPGRIDQIQKAKGDKQWGKVKKEPTKQEISEVAEMAGIDLNADISEGQRLKTIYDAALKKLEFEEKQNTLIDSKKVEASEAFAGRVIKESCLAIADRCAALCAAESDPFEVKKILLKEINFILESISAGVLKFNADVCSS
jgi:hypothetical protein